ncbi:MAG: histidine kinase [Chitinophagaceae bacterium]
MSRKIYPFPDKYKTLSTDQLKMEFLVKIVSDSLNEDQLTPVYNWSVQGLLLAEKNKVDSMKGIFNYFIGKAFTYKYLKPDSAIYYYKKVLPYFPDKLRKYNVFSVREIMERYSEMGNKDSSFVYLDSLKALIDTMPEFDPKRVSLSQNIATVYQWFGMFKTAIAYYQLSVNGARKNGHLPGLGMALANLGELYNESEDDQKAIQTSKEALGYLENITMPYMKTASNLASYYNNLEIYDSAFIYLKKSDSIAKKVGDREQQITNSIIWADFFLIQKKYNQAKSLLAKILNELNGGNNTWGLAKAYLSAAALDTMLHSYTAAKNKLIKSLGISKKNKQEVLVVIALQNLAVVLFKLKDYKSAFHYQQEYLMRKDSLSNEKTKAALADLEISYQTKQKEEQIALLKKDNAIKKLELQNNRRTLIFYILAFLMALTIAVVIFYQRNLRTSIKVQKIKAELENKVLRLQMNPHFIFNSLNSIENFIMQNEKRLASDYLNKFARLIRMILDSSRNEVVPIAKDMEALQLYIDLEQLRFNNRFSYKTIIDPILAGGDYRVPSLLIQPYVENAIVHGLAHSEEKGLMLTVMASLENEKIKYTVQDNGVGRAQASVYNQQNKPYHKSVGLKITEDRINLFNKHPDGNDFVHFTDLLDNEKNPAGTRVEIMLNTI